MTVSDGTDSSARSLYRVGPPRISDVWINSFTASRGSGGLGTGVYAYASREGAETDGAYLSGKFPVSTYPNALRDPLVLSPDSDRPHEPAYRLHDISRVLDLIGRRHRQTEGDYISTLPDDIREFDPYRDDDYPDKSYVRKFSVNLSWLSLQLPVGDHFGTYDEDRVWTLARQACREAAAQSGSPHTDRSFSQPINYLLGPQFDGVYLHPRAGGDSNKWGCVIFKEQVDACVGRETQQDEDLDPEALRECFAPGAE